MSRKNIMEGDSLFDVEGRNIDFSPQPLDSLLFLFFSLEGFSFLTQGFPVKFYGSLLFGVGGGGA